MNKRSRKKQQEASAAEPVFNLDRLSEIDDDQGLSLDELSRAYAQLLNQGDDPFPQGETPGADETAAKLAEEPAVDLADRQEQEGPERELTPSSILEAMLFVGDPHNQPLSSRQVAALMRGVPPSEIDDMVAELNREYESQNRPFRVTSTGNGYRLVLNEQFQVLSQRFHGRHREARLSQAAVDVLAIVAYNQGLTREEIDVLRDRPCGALLSQLVRRQLLRVERTTTKPRRMRYFTADRFLELFHLSSLDDLPQAE